MEKKRISLPIIVEGKYDKNTVLQIFDATVITTGGFAVFNSAERRALIRRVGASGIILLTDPDGAGKQLRSFLSGILPKDKIFNAYVPKIEGKERRKAHPSKAGLLGVEGVGRDAIEKALSPFISGREEMGERVEITTTHVYLDGLSGGADAKERRARLARYFELPDDITANALLSALNIITDEEGYRRAIKEIFK